MNVYNWLVVLLITFITIMIVYFAIRKEGSPIRKAVYIFLTAGIYIHSGIGISSTIVNNKYILSYTLFLISILFSIKLTLGLRITKVGIWYDRNSSFKNECSLDFDCNSPIFSWLSVIFFLTLAINLFYPTFRISDLWKPSQPSSSYIYARKSALNSYFIIRFSEMLRTFLLPFFFIYLFKLVRKGNKLKVLCLIALWAYLDYLIFNYLGRYQIITYILFAYSITAFITQDGIKITKGKLITISLIFVSLVPFMVSYMALRVGSANADISFLESLQILFKSETRTPEYYAAIEDFAGEDSILTFLLWIICLPIPSFIFPQKPAITTNYLFTYKIKGLMYGAQDYYSSVLPSILGESFIIWGMSFYWIHGIIVGLVIGLILKFLEKYKSLSVLYMYLVIMILVLGRGGASSYLPKIINSTFPIYLWLKLFKKTGYRNINNIY